jgi:hypothetical protein
MFHKECPKFLILPKTPQTRQLAVRVLAPVIENADQSLSRQLQLSIQKKQSRILLVIVELKSITFTFEIHVSLSRCFVVLFVALAIEVFGHTRLP